MGGKSARKVIAVSGKSREAAGYKWLSQVKPASSKGKEGEYRVFHYLAAN